jgi:trehalose 6-phosphate phosphatase
VSGRDTSLDALLVRAVEAFARRERVLVAVDFDGTLAPIVEDPDSSAPLPQAAEAIATLVSLPGTHVAVVSGRALERLRRLLEPPDDVVLVGSHGAEIDGGDGPLDDDEQRLLTRVRDAVDEIVAAHPGTSLEEKPAGVVLHTRRAGRAAALGATADGLQGPGRWPGVHALPGKEMVELAVTDVTKGRALHRLRTELGLDQGGVFFAGDDTTDEQAFEVLDDEAGDVTVKVGEGRTAARHRVVNPGELAELLALLARLRRDASA